MRTSKAGRAVLVRNKEFVIVPPDEQVRIAKAEGSGPVGQFLEFLDDMLTTDHNRNQRSTTALAAVVKGYDNKPKTSGLSDPALEALQPGANASQDDSSGSVGSINGRPRRRLPLIRALACGCGKTPA